MLTDLLTEDGKEAMGPSYLQEMIEPYTPQWVSAYINQQVDCTNNLKSREQAPK